MRQKPAENTLLLGNGFTRAIFKDIPSWNDFFEGIDSSVQNNTMLYESFRLQAGRSEGRDDKKSPEEKENAIKGLLMCNVLLPIKETGIKRGIKGINKFGCWLKGHSVHNIITTNYDNAIEFMLCRFCGYQEEKPKEVYAEKVYNVRTCKILYNPGNDHSIKLWKIHGDPDRIQSVVLGFDHYCGELARLMDYVKGKYRSSDDPPTVICDTPIKEKCKDPTLRDNLSWVELFFHTNLYIVGFGMDFSEIDIWWLLNKRARFMLELPQINNRIAFLYNRKYENKKKKPALFASLKAFEVDCEPIAVDNNYIFNIFNHIG